MTYPYLNQETKEIFYVDFPEDYAIKLHGSLTENDLILDVKINRFVPIGGNASLMGVSDFYIVLSLIEKSNIIPFPKSLKVENAMVAA